MLKCQNYSKYLGKSDLLALYLIRNFFLFKYFIDVLKLINIKADDLFSAIVKSPTLSSKALLKWAKNRYKVFPVSHQHIMVSFCLKEKYKPL